MTQETDFRDKTLKEDEDDDKTQQESEDESLPVKEKQGFFEMREDAVEGLGYNKINTNTINDQYFQLTGVFILKFNLTTE